MLPCLFLLSACTTGALNQSGRLLTRHTTPKLYADLPDTIRVPAILAAGQATLASRGYTITDRQINTEIGWIIARSGGHGIAGQQDQVIIRGNTTATGSRASIAIAPLGNDARARHLMDDLLGRLNQ